MSDEIRNKKPNTEDDESSREISTSDLAGTRRPTSRTIPIEPDIERNERTGGERTGTEPAEAATKNPANPSSAGRRATATAPAMEQETGPLFAGSEANQLRSRWDAIQVAFVDEPRQAVQQADHLVADTMKRLAEIFAEERNNLEHQWDKGEGVSTEDLRVALRRYRSFFSRLLSV